MDTDQLLKDLNIHNSKSGRGLSGIAFISLLALLSVGVVYYLYTNQSTKDNSASTQAQVIDLPAKTNENASKQSTSTIQFENPQSSTKKEALNLKESAQINAIEQVDENLASSKTATQSQALNSIPIDTKTYKNNINQKQQTNRPNSNDELSKNSQTNNIEFLNRETNSIASNDLLNNKSELQVTQLKQLNPKKSNDQVSTLSKDVDQGLQMASLSSPTASVEYLGKSMLPVLKDCPTFKDRLWSFSFIPEVGYQWPIKSLKTNDPLSEDLLIRRNQEEITLESFQGAVYFELKHNSGFYLKPGISVSKITEQFRLQDEITITLEREEVIAVEIIVNPDSSITTQEIKETTTFDTTQTVNITENYTINQIDLPIAVGYTKLLDGFAIDFEVGVKMNLLTTTSGTLFTGQEPNTTSLGKENIYFKNAIGLGIFGGINIRKQLNTFGEVYLAPRFQYHTQTFSSNFNPIRQRYSVFGLHLGYVYTFAVK